MNRAPHSEVLTPADVPNLLAQRLGWRQLFPAVVLRRGIDYAREQRVEGLAVEADGTQGFAVSGRVHGNEPYAYQTSVRLRRRGTQWSVASRCSCPLGGQCKHVVALLAITEASAVDPLQEWERWIRTVESAGTLPSGPELGSDRRLWLVLRRSGSLQLTVDPVWFKPLKRAGSWGEGRPLLASAQGPVPAPPGGWSVELEEPLTLLLAGAGHYSYRQPVPVISRAQEQALVDLLERLPACWDKPSQPLERGPQATLTLDWRSRDDGSQRLVPVADGAGDAALLLRACGLWYVDAHAGHYGRVDGDPAVLERLRSAPRLLPEQADAVRERLRRVPRLRQLMTPAAQREPVDTLSARAQPILVLRALPRRASLRNGTPVSERIGVAQLSFSYDGQRLPAGRQSVVRQLSGDRLIDVRRHRADENAAYDALAELHLLPAEVVGGALPDADLRPGDHLYVPRQLPAGVGAWLSLLPRLREAGFTLEFDAEFPYQLVSADGAIRAELAPGEADTRDWFRLRLDIELDGERIDLLPVLRRLLADPGFPLQPRPGEAEDAQWLVPLDERRIASLPLARLRAIVEPLLEWLEAPGERVDVRPAQAAVLDALASAPGVITAGGETLRDSARRLREGPKASDPAPGFASTLRGYQREGLAWLDVLDELGAGGILADDMGLGKTVQVLAHLHGLKARGRLAQPALVVCPTTLVGNWAAEAARHAPQLRVLVLHGPLRAAAFARISEHDVVITTYPLLPRDGEALVAARFSLLVLDEAQQIKNARTQAAAVVRRLRVRRRLAMTGTPLENHLGELWAQFDAVEPGLLGSEKRFASHYRTPIEKQGDVARRAQLLARIAPLMLRRRKADVLHDLPEKTEIVRHVELEGRQRELYETLRLAQHERVREAVSQRGLAGSGIVVLDALLKLRQVCCDPRLVKLDGVRRVQQSAKLDLLLEMLERLVDEGRRTLVFSQFTEMLALISRALEQRGLAHLTLTGASRGRAALVRRFQEGEAPIFLISLKAGGTGLNLTAADTVIHYDPWWNPAVEAQATDRAHRIGQRNAVFVYRLVCAGTIEEQIQALQGAKAELARAVLEGGSSARLRFGEADLDALFAPLGGAPQMTPEE